MNVVWVCLEWPREEHTGGVARYAYRLATEIAGLVDLTIVTGEGGFPVAGARMRFIRIPRGRFARYYLAPFRVRSVLHDERPAVIHAFGDDWAIGRTSARRVRHFLGSSLAEARTSRGLRRANHYLLSLLEHVSAWKADVRIAIGADSRDEFHCEYVMPPVVPLPAPSEAKSEPPTLVFVGSHGDRKRGWMAEQVLLGARAAGFDARLVVIGPAADRGSWPPDIEHVSGADDEEVRRRIAGARVLLSPSSYEGFGIPIFEGLALGTRVVATANAGSRFQASIAGPDSSLAVVADEMFVPTAIAAIARGDLTDSERRADAAAVKELLASASAERLARTLYLGRTEE